MRRQLRPARKYTSLSIDRIVVIRSRQERLVLATNPNAFPLRAISGRARTTPCHAGGTHPLPQLSMIRSEIGVLLLHGKQLSHPTVAFHRQRGQSIRLCLLSARHASRGEERQRYAQPSHPPHETHIPA